MSISTAAALMKVAGKRDGGDTAESRRRPKRPECVAEVLHGTLQISRLDAGSPQLLRRKPTSQLSTFSRAPMATGAGGVRGSGLGIENMKRRAIEIGGDLVMAPNDAGGLTVTLVFDPQSGPIEA